MVEALTQQMANVISLLSANFNPIPQVQQKLLPAKTSDDPRLQSTRAKFLKTPNEKTNVSEKLKPQQLTPAERKALNDKLKQSIKSKIENRSQGSPNTSTHSRFSSQSSVMEEDEIVDEQTLETKFKTVTAISVDETIGAKEVNLNTSLQASCISISVPFKINICSVYFPPLPFVLDRQEQT
ncbi:hypothetical protein J6590_040141 [Homalodisca vitripennis]|nr:hypothetical protein J6590_040141 [Homalodisca vitripennis]